MLLNSVYSYWLTCACTFTGFKSAFATTDARLLLESATFQGRNCCSAYRRSPLVEYAMSSVWPARLGLLARLKTRCPTLERRRRSTGKDCREDRGMSLRIGRRSRVWPLDRGGIHLNSYSQAGLTLYSDHNLTTSFQFCVYRLIVSQLERLR